MPTLPLHKPYPYSLYRFFGFLHFRYLQCLVRDASKSPKLKSSSLENKWAAWTKPLWHSIESWLVNGDPYNGSLLSLYNWVVLTLYIKQPTGGPLNTAHSLRFVNFGPKHPQNHQSRCLKPPIQVPKYPRLPLSPPNERNPFINCWLGVWGMFQGYVGKFFLNFPMFSRSMDVFWGAGFSGCPLAVTTTCQALQKDVAAEKFLRVSGFRPKK